MNEYLRIPGSGEGFALDICLGSSSEASIENP